MNKSPRDDRHSSLQRRTEYPNKVWRRHPQTALQRDKGICIGRRIPRPNYQKICRLRKVQAAGEPLATADRPVVVKRDIWKEEALSHNTGVQLLFLGTGRGHPAEQRRVGSMAMKLSRSTWLFDCGEDTQRLVHKQPLIRHGKLDRIFITNRRSSNILGLPGMLCTMSSAREVGLDLADMPLHIYGPPGLATFVRPLLQLSDTYIAMPIIVHEFVDHAVSVEEMENPEQLDQRSCLFRVLLPPDKLNPKGYYDGTLAPFLSRASARTNAMARGVDERVNHRQLPLPPPGNPAARVEGMHDMQWTIMCDQDQCMKAVRVPADVPSWAFLWQEADRVGALDVDRCQQLHLGPGRHYRMLKEGKPVRNRLGELVDPKQVVAPDIPGRRLIVVGESSDSMPLVNLAQGADAVIHSASCEEAQDGGGSVVRNTIDLASKFSRAANAQHLVLYRFKVGESPVEDGCVEGEKATWGSLNTLGNRMSTSKYWDVVESPSDVVEATEKLASSIFGKERKVHVAEDMDLFAVERRLQPPWEADDKKATEENARVAVSS